MSMCLQARLIPRIFVAQMKMMPYTTATAKRSCTGLINSHPFILTRSLQYSLCSQNTGAEILDFFPVRSQYIIRADMGDEIYPYKL